jgi:crotonobetainyl-CoA:carnitine CoA-transferase CaiB-like acyl-CoA transferase
VTRDEAFATIERWTAMRAPAEVMEVLPGRGVPAAMLRSPDLLGGPQLRYRATFSSLRDPANEAGLPAEPVAAPYTWLPEIEDLASRGILHEQQVARVPTAVSDEQRGTR